MPWDQPLGSYKADVLKRKPLGPRGLPVEQGSLDSGYHTTHLRPISGLDQGPGREGFHVSTASSLHPQLPQPETFHSFYTLIRRDPASGKQTNVGTIEGFKLSEHGTATSSMSVAISNPGYAKITGADEFQCRIEKRGRAKSVSGEVDDGKPGTSSSSRKGGFGFVSPWGGQCEFMTGSGGRNLKVRQS